MYGLLLSSKDGVLAIPSTSSRCSSNCWLLKSHTLPMECHPTVKNPLVGILFWQLVVWCGCINEQRAQFFHSNATQEQGFHGVLLHGEEYKGWRDLIAYPERIHCSISIAIWKRICWESLCRTLSLNQKIVPKDWAAFYGVQISTVRAPEQWKSPITAISFRGVIWEHMFHHPPQFGWSNKG